MNKKIYKMMVMFVVGFGIFLITVGTAGACEPCSEEELAAERCVEFDFNDDNSFDWVLRLESSEPSGEGYTYSYSLERKPADPVWMCSPESSSLAILPMFITRFRRCWKVHIQFHRISQKMMGQGICFDGIYPSLRQIYLFHPTRCPAVLEASIFQLQLQSCSPLQEQKSNSGQHQV
jgi:hypothetical protein